MSHNPASIYLRDVLGMKWAPKSQSQPKVVVVAEASLSSAQRALIERMMSAVGLKNYQITNEIMAGPGVGLVMDESRAFELQIGDIGQTVFANGRKWWRTFATQELIDGQDLQNKKRQAWSHLQEMTAGLEALQLDLAQPIRDTN